MTFYHFANCVALAYVPYYLTYKLSGLSEYGVFWKCISAGGLYMVTQLCKMLFLATFFPAGDDEFDRVDGHHDEVEFDLFTEFLKVTVDLADLVGLYLIMQRVAGKGLVKIMVAGLGWSCADLFFSRIIYLWVGARGIEFDWKYLQNSFDANINLVHFLTLAALVWIWQRRDMSNTLAPILVVLLAVTSYQTFFMESLVHVMGLAVSTVLFYKAMFASCLAFITLQLYASVTAGEKY